MKFFKSNIFYILLAGFFLRILLSFFGTLQLDHGTFIAWSRMLTSGGFHNFYSGWSDYLPGYLYVLWILGKINLLGFIPEVILYKLPAILADLATGFLIYKIFSKYKKEKLGMLGAGIYLFNPAIFANSALWGQVDSLTALASVLAIYLLDINFLASAVAISIGTLIKPQAAFILPVILIFLFRKRNKFTDLLLYCFVGLVIFVLAFVPFSNGKIFGFILGRLEISAGQYPYTSINAFNFWGLFGFWKPDNLFFQFSAYALVFVVTIFLSIKYSKDKFSSYILAAFVFAASFFFFTRMHERHLLPVFAPLAVAAAANPVFLIPYVGLSIIYILNLTYSYFWITNNFTPVLSDFIIKILIVIGISLLIFLVRNMVKNTILSWSNLPKKIFGLFDQFKSKNIVTNNLPKIKLSAKKSKTILIIILAFALTTRVFKLGSPPTMYFDEVYHAFTAKTMLGADFAKAWEWWNTPPEGFAYEWTHPPMAKLGMAAGMLIFGQNSFGWRIPGALLGVGAVFLIYLIAKKLFKDEVVGLISAAVFSLDGLPLVMSRIGMNDSYILFFSLFSIYLFMKEKDFLSATFYGFALASKWSALWAAPIIFFLWLKRKNKFKTSILWFLLLPFAVYLLSYLPMFTTGHNLKIWWGMQQQMWWYHTRLRASHPYTSPWWSWPLLARPIYLYTNDEIGGFVSRIYAMGNPFVFLPGLVSVGVCAVYSFLEKNKKLGFIVFSYLIFFAPWAASPRIMFFYHYLPSIPFLAIAIGYVLRRFPKLIYIFLPLILLAFIYFYPHWTGLQIPLWLDRSYYWTSSWR